MKKTVTNLIPQETIEVKGPTIQGNTKLFIHINKFLAKYDYEKINKIVFLGGSRKDLCTISEYMFAAKKGRKSSLQEVEHRYTERLTVQQKRAKNFGLSQPLIG